MTRRNFLLASSGALGVCALAGSGKADVANELQSVPGGGEQDFLVIDSHLHLFGDEEEDERIFQQCRRAGIDKICAFLSGSKSAGAVADDPNRAVLELRRRHPSDMK